MRVKVLPGVFGVFLLGFMALAWPASRVEASAPVYLNFDKSGGGGGVWNGTVSGDIHGDLTTTLTDLRVSGPVWHVVFTWDIDDTDLGDGDQSFVATLSGVLNTKTGAVVMNGTVTDGYLLGAQVHEEGQLIDPATLRFNGSIRVMPESTQ